MRRPSLISGGLISGGPLRALVARARAGRRRVRVSVIVVVTDDNAVFLSDCLASLADQTARPSQVLLAVTGTGADTAQIVALARREARKARVLALPGATTAAAVNAAATVVSGSYLLALGAGERLVPTAIRALTEVPADAVGMRGPAGIALPPVLFRTRFWRGLGLSVPETPWDLLEPQAGAARKGAVVRVVEGPVTGGGARGTGLGFTALPVLGPHAGRWAEAASALRDRVGDDELDWWLLANEVPRFLTDAERLDDTGWAALRRVVAAVATPDHVRRLEVEPRVQVHLALQDRRDDLASFTAERWQQVGYDVRVDGPAVYALLPVTDVPAEILRTQQVDRRPPRMPPPDEVRPRSQRLLQQWYAEAPFLLDEGLAYFQSYQGAVTDSPLAIHQELQRTHPGMRTVWAVASEDTAVPAGATPVRIGSRAWYAALAAAGWIVTNVDLDRWFAKRPGQRVLQTFHGYPSKSMGIAAWEGKGLTPLRIERQLRRTSGTWDLLVTPSPAMDVHYREQYRYTGEIVAAGLPRDDVLVSPQAEQIRVRARSRLGIGDRTAVLYAPTWRDDLTTGFRAAPLRSTFDVEDAARRLGPGYVILVRGHRFHRRRPRLDASLLDVSEHPEINELILASDAAVLDYSSLRFDFSLTGRPMVFLVPDLERYAGSTRGFLYDFRTSAPGPLVGDTSEVVAELRDLEGLRARWADAYAQFHATFHTMQDGHAAERVVHAFFGPGRG